MESVAFCEALPLAVTGDTDGNINIWDMGSYRLRQKLKHEVTNLNLIWIHWFPQETVTRLIFAKASPILFSASVDRTVKVWDVRTGELGKTFRGHQEAVLDIAVSNDGRSVVSASDDGTALVFSLDAPAEPSQ